MEWEFYCFGKKSVNLQSIRETRLHYADASRGFRKSIWKINSDIYEAKEKHPKIGVTN